MNLFNVNHVIGSVNKNLMLTGVKWKDEMGATLESNLIWK